MSEKRQLTFNSVNLIISLSYEVMLSLSDFSLFCCFPRILCKVAIFGYLGKRFKVLGDGILLLLPWPKALWVPGSYLAGLWGSCLWPEASGSASYPQGMSVNFLWLVGITPVLLNGRSWNLASYAKSSSSLVPEHPPWSPRRHHFFPLSRPPGSSSFRALNAWSPWGTWENCLSGPH